MKTTWVFGHVLIIMAATSALAFPARNDWSVPLLAREPEKNCTPKDQTGCSCEMTDGSGVVDLTSVGYTNNEPRFKDYTAPDGAMYSYNPCYGFTEGKCINSAVCMTHGKSMLSIGQADHVMFQYAQDLKTVVTAYFTHQTIVVAAEVELICDPNACEPVFDPLGEIEMGLYLFKMTSVCACPGMCTSSGASNCKSSSGLLQVGTFICIGVFIVLCVYFVCGILYNKIRNKASGSDLVPHQKFWSSLPGLIKDGVFFTFGRRLGNEQKYQPAAT